MVLSVHQFLPVRRLDFLVVEFKARKLDADDCEQDCPGRRRDDCKIDQRMRDGPDPRELGDVLAQGPEERQERDQCHHRTHEGNAQALDDPSEAHRVFLYALSGAFDMANLVPVRHVVVVHRRPPAKHVVADVELEQHRHGDVDGGDLGEGQALCEKVGELHRPWLGQCLLQRVVEVSEPLVDPDVELHLVPSDRQDRDAAQQRPMHPPPVGEEGPEHKLSPVGTVIAGEPASHLP